MVAFFVASPMLYALLAVGALATFVTMRYDLRLSHNMILYGLIISFPLVFSLQSAFKRRDKALEYLSLFVAGLQLVRESFRHDEKLAPEAQEHVQTLVGTLQQRLFAFLQQGRDNPKEVLAAFGGISAFMVAHREESNKRISLRIHKYMAYVYRAASGLVAFKTHRTSTGIRLLSRVFITLFPFVQAPVLWHNAHDKMPTWGIYLVVLVTAIILAILLVVQDQLEDPFDQTGLDDIKLEQFKL